MIIKKIVIVMACLLSFKVFPTQGSELILDHDENNYEHLHPTLTLGHDWDNYEPLHPTLSNKQFFLELSSQYCENLSMFFSLVPGENSELLARNFQELAIKGSPHAIDIIWRFAKGCLEGEEHQVKAELVRDFLSENDIHIVALGELGINIHDRIKRFPQFDIILKNIINHSIHADALRAKLNLALGLSYVSRSLSGRVKNRQNIRRGWKMIREFQNHSEAYSEFSQREKYVSRAYGFLFTKVLKIGDTQLKDEVILYLVSNQLTFVQDVNSAFFKVFGQLSDIQKDIKILQDIDEAYEKSLS
jgi:hypothetical protein